MLIVAKKMPLTLTCNVFCSGHKLVRNTSDWAMGSAVKQWRGSRG